MENSILEQFKLTGRVALIVGGNRGLGLAMAKALAEAGASISIAARDENKNIQSQKEIQSGYGVNCISIQCDVTSEESIKNAVQTTVTKFGKIDILINSAGINIRGKIEGLSVDDFNQVQQVNVTGSWIASREVVPIMKKNGYGRIINIGSMLSVTAIPERTPYATSKGAILQLTRALAMEVAKYGITVNTISPGYIGTDMVMAVPEKVLTQIIAQVPMGRLGGTHEVAHLVSFLASEETSFITGANYSINGGQHVY